jgi:phosphohistidine phosphatase
VNRQLYVLRHAKSSWDTGHADHDRPLNGRGRRAVAALRGHFAEEGIAPDVVLCSTAVRTVETWEGVKGGLREGIEVRLEEGLYGASADEVLTLVQDVEDSAERVMVVGHNPGLEDLVAGLVGSGDVELRRRMEAKFPTGALATLSVQGGWAELDWGGAELVGFVVPRELA